MSRLVGVAGWRFFVRHPWQLALAILGVALGVAVVTGVDLAGSSARRSFDLSREAVVGRSTHQIISQQGRIAETVYATLRLDGGVRAAAPVIAGRVRVRDAEPVMLNLMGVDPFAEAPFRDYVRTGGNTDFDLTRFLTEPGAFLATRELAARLGIGLDEPIVVQTSAGRSGMRLAGWLEVDEARRGLLADYMIADLATAQEVLGRPGQLSHIDLIIGTLEESRIRDLLPAGVDLVTTAGQTRSVHEMTRAFRINLLALSLLALVVGAFLIYSTMSFLVVQRRAVIGTLRTMGVTRRQLFGNVLRESMLIGVPGTVIGLALGWLLGAGLTGLVVRTIDDLYFRLELGTLQLDATALVKGALLGLGVTCVAALGPAFEAAAVPPRAVLSRASLERRARRRLPALALIAVGVALLGVSAIRFLPGSLVAGFAGLFAIIAAGALLAPPAIAALVRLILAVAGARLTLPIRMAVRGVSASLSRTGVAVAALMVAVATVIGVGVMVGSFRQSVDHWLQRSLTADVYLSLDEAYHAAGEDASAMVERLLATDVIGSVSRQVRTRLRTESDEIRVWGLDPGRSDWGLEVIDGEPIAARGAFERGDAVVVSEPFARRRGLAPDDTLVLPAPDGARSFQVAAVFRDYTSDRGVVAVYLPVFRRVWGMQRLDGVGLFATSGVDAGAVKIAAERVVGDAPGATVAANAEIRTISLSIFDRTFTITRVLQFLVGVVAFLGILSALQSLQMERVRELAVLRALGWTPAQVRQLVIGQTTLLGSSAGLLAVPLGLLLAFVLIDVINTRAFGWSMGFHAEPGVIGQGLLVAVTAAVLGGLYPAWRAGQRRPAVDLRDE